MAQELMTPEVRTLLKDMSATLTPMIKTGRVRVMVGHYATLKKYLETINSLIKREVEKEQLAAVVLVVKTLTEEAHVTEIEGSKLAARVKDQCSRETVPKPKKWVDFVGLVEKAGGVWEYTDKPDKNSKSLPLPVSIVRFSDGK